MTADQSYGNNAQFSRDMRDRYLTLLYHQVAQNDHFVFLDGEQRAVKTIQQEIHIDTLLCLKSGAYIGIEEKIRRRITDDLLVEIQQNSRSHKKGWIYSSKADVLLYCFAMLGEQNSTRGLACFWLDMPALQAWFCEREGRYKRHIGVHASNRPMFCLVPFDDLPDALLLRRFVITSQHCREIDLKTGELLPNVRSS